MVQCSNAQSVLRRFAMTDGLFRSTAWSANVLMSAVIATVGGFGPSAILLSSSVQMTISGLLEFPTGVLADRFGAKNSVKLGFCLKLLVSTLFLVSLYFASKGNAPVAYLLLAGEAVADAFASAFINGAYQSAYMKFYDLECNKLNIPVAERPPLFTASFKIGRAHV